MNASRVSLLIAVVLVAALVGGCEQPSTSDVDQTGEGVLRLGSVEAVDTVARAVAPTGRPLVIDGFRGQVALQGADQETADLQFVRRARGESAEAARGVLEDVTITESGSDQAYTYTLETNGRAYSAVDVRGTVPRGGELRVERESGPVSISGVDGPLTVRHDHGPVTIRGATGSVTVETKNGDLDVALRAVPADASVALRTKNGDVTLRLPPAASVQLNVETSAGVIRTQGLPLTDQEFMPRDAGGEYAAQLGPGDASVELHTENGSVLVQSAEADTTDAPMGGPDTISPPPSDTTVTAPSAPDTASAGGAPQADTAASGPAPAPDTATSP
jgi:hypothetical protein